MNDFVVQLIVFVGVAFFILSYQIKSNRALFLFQLIGPGCVCCSYEKMLKDYYIVGGMPEAQNSLSYPSIGMTDP